MVYTMDGGETASIAARRALAIELKNKGYTWKQVAEEVPYLDAEGNPSRAHACVDVKRALEMYRRDLTDGIEDMLNMADMRLDGMRRVVHGVLSRPHYLAQHGKIVYDGEGNPVRDDAPILAAIDRLLRIEERWARLHGMDSPKELKIALERRSDMEAVAVTEAILAGFDAAELPADKRREALEAAQNRLGTIEGEVVQEGEG